MNETSSASGASSSRCQKCGAELRPGYSFCAECGAPAAPSASPQPNEQPAGDTQPRAAAHYEYTPSKAKAAAPGGSVSTSARSLPRHLMLYIVIAVLAVVALVELFLLFGGSRSQASASDLLSNALLSGESVSEDFSFGEADAKTMQEFAAYRDGYADFSVSEPVLLLRRGESTEVSLTLKHHGTSLYYSAPSSLDISVGSFTPLIGQTCTVTVTARETGVSIVSFTNSANREELRMLVIVVN